MINSLYQHKCKYNTPMNWGSLSYWGGIHTNIGKHNFSTTTNTKYKDCGFTTGMSQMCLLLNDTTNPKVNPIPMPMGFFQLTTERVEWTKPDRVEILPPPERFVCESCSFPHIFNGIHCPQCGGCGTSIYYGM